jgi:hypothetical protein
MPSPFASTKLDAAGFLPWAGEEGAVWAATSAAAANAAKAIVAMNARFMMSSRRLRQARIHEGHGQDSIQRGEKIRGR